ncbi:hypothetical protein VTJ04DRAFT_6437 [Mycothermus thermophilus]|uniref:uncharacterized protein n=1 Tax=Humicola insolens TaxID=85995 RepID=UPI003744ADFD
MTQRHKARQGDGGSGRQDTAGWDQWGETVEKMTEPNLEDAWFKKTPGQWQATDEVVGARAGHSDPSAATDWLHRRTPCSSFRGSLQTSGQTSFGSRSPFVFFWSRGLHLDSDLEILPLDKEHDSTEANM